MSEDPKRWSQPFAALLGAYNAQIGFGLPSIGGKDSMSGTFNDIDVPPTLVSFAVDIAKEKDIITPELKAVGDQLVLFTIKKDEFDLPDYAQVMKLYDTIHALIQAGVIVSAYALDGKDLQQQSARWHLVTSLALRSVRMFPKKHYLLRDSVTLLLKFQLKRLQR